MQGRLSRAAAHAWLPGCAAGVQMQEAVPDACLPEYNIEEEENPDVRLGRCARDHLVLALRVRQGITYPFFCKIKLSRGSTRI